MRVTESIRLADAARWITQTQTQLDRLSAQAATGRAVERPSDGPAAYASIVRRGEQIARLESRQTAMEMARARLELSEGALAASADVMLRAREIATQMADGTFGASDRAAAAIEVELLREEIRAQANARGADGGYLFAGTLTDTEPFDPGGGYLGNGATARVEYAEGQYMASSVTGVDAFAAPGGRDVFADLDALVAALQADDQAGVRASLDTLDAGREQLVAARGGAGVRLGRLESAEGVTDAAVALQLTQRGREQDTDFAAVATELSLAQGAYQRALTVTQQLLQLTGSLEPF
ncbi:MAG: hypothetical protein AAF928_02370 [Myxococcota bacterium]